MITWENYEEFMMMHADGELRPDEEQELVAFVNEHPELKKELGVYELTRLTPDTTQVFADKNSLLKPVNKKRTIAFPVWGRYSIAAGVAALIFVSLFKYLNPQTPEGVSPQVVVETKKTGTKALSQLPDKKTEEISDGKLAAKQEPVKVKPVIHKETRVALVPKVKIEHKNKNEVEHVPSLKQNVIAISELSLAGTKEMPRSENRVQSLIVKDVPEFTMPGNAEETRKTFWDKLPIDDIKKKQMQNIAGTIADVYDDVNAAKQNLYDKSITIDVKVQKRKLVISF